MNSKFKQYFGEGASFLWTLVVTFMILHGGQAVGIDWGLSEKYAFGRFVKFFDIAVIELLLALILIFARLLINGRPSLILFCISIAVVLASQYLMYFYMLGVENLLFWGAGWLAYVNLPKSNTHHSTRNRR
jgi:hypothetical protein|nr:hypothetical protein [uncultured Undibacterium sp.]